jgi:hypothetical protein
VDLLGSGLDLLDGRAFVGVERIALVMHKRRVIALEDLADDVQGPVAELYSRDHRKPPHGNDVGKAAVPYDVVVQQAVKHARRPEHIPDHRQRRIAAVIRHWRYAASFLNKRMKRSSSTNLTQASVNTALGGFTTASNSPLRLSSRTIQRAIGLRCGCSSAKAHA